MFVHYDTDIQTAVRNKCSHVMEGVYEKQKKKREKAEISFFDRIINGTIYNNAVSYTHLTLPTTSRV